MSTAALSLDAALSVLRQPWQARRRGSGLRIAALTLALVLVPIALLSAWLRVGWATWAGLSGLALLIGLWWATVEGLVQQNRPELARLLPGQLRQLRVNLLVHALALGLAACACLALVAGLQLSWVWLVAGTGLLLAWLARSPMLWIPASFVGAGMPWLIPGPLPVARAVAALPWSLQVALAVAMVALLLQLLGDGGAAHRRRYERRQRWAAMTRAQTEGRTVSAAAMGPFWFAVSRCFTWPLAVHRRRLLRRPTPANALQRLDLGLATGGQGAMMAWMMVLIGGGLGLVLALVAHFNPGVTWERLVDASRIGLCAGAFNLLCAPLLGRPAALCSRRGEQALLVLVPGVPTGAALMAQLEARWRLEHVIAWVAVSAPVLALAALGSADTLAFTAAFSACCLPMVWLSQWRHRRGRAAPLGNALWMMSPSLVIVPALAAMRLELPPWSSLGAGMLVYALLAWRVPKPQRAQLPTGR